MAFREEGSLLYEVGESDTFEKDKLLNLCLKFFYCNNYITIFNLSDIQAITDISRRHNNINLSFFIRSCCQW